MVDLNFLTRDPPTYKVDLRSGIRVMQYSTKNDALMSINSENFCRQISIQNVVSSVTSIVIFISPGLPKLGS